MIPSRQVKRRNSALTDEALPFILFIQLSEMNCTPILRFISNQTALLPKKAKI